MHTCTPVAAHAAPVAPIHAPQRLHEAAPSPQLPPLPSLTSCHMVLGLRVLRLMLFLGSTHLLPTPPPYLSAIMAAMGRGGGSARSGLFAHVDPPS